MEENVTFNWCECCGSGIFFSPGLGYDGKGGPKVCHMCESRGRLCLHNINEREDKSFHYSVWHEVGDHGEAPPKTCQWCLARSADPMRGGLTA